MGFRGFRGAELEDGEISRVLLMALVRYIV
jgi:hypothetical protein